MNYAEINAEKVITVKYAGNLCSCEKKLKESLKKFRLTEIRTLTSAKFE